MRRVLGIQLSLLICCLAAVPVMAAKQVDLIKQENQANQKVIKSPVLQKEQEDDEENIVPSFANEELGCLQFSEAGMAKLISFGVDTGLKKDGKIVLEFKKIGTDLIEGAQNLNLSILPVDNGSILEQAPTHISAKINNFGWNNLEFGAAQTKFDPKSYKVNTCIPINKFDVIGDFATQLLQSDAEIQKSFLKIKKLNLGLRNKTETAPQICFTVQLTKEGKLKAIDWSEEADSPDNELLKSAPNSFVVKLLSTKDDHDLLLELRNMKCFRKENVAVAQKNEDGLTVVATVSLEKGIDVLTPYPLTPLDEQCIDKLKDNFDNMEQAKAFYRMYKAGTGLISENSNFTRSVVNKIIRAPLLEKINQSLEAQYNDTSSQLRQYLDYIRLGKQQSIPSLNIQDLIYTPWLDDAFLKLDRPLSDKRDMLVNSPYTAWNKADRKEFDELLETVDTWANKRYDGSKSTHIKEILDYWKTDLSNIRDCLSNSDLSSVEGKKYKEVTCLMLDLDKVGRKIADNITNAPDSDVQIKSNILEGAKEISQVNKIVEKASFGIYCPGPSSLCDHTNKSDLHANISLNSINTYLARLNSLNMLDFCFDSNGKKESDKIEISDLKEAKFCGNDKGGGIYCRFSGPPHLEYDDGKSAFIDQNKVSYKAPHFKISIKDLSCGFKNLQSLQPLFGQNASVYMRLAPYVNKQASNEGEKIDFHYNLDPHLLPGGLITLLTEILFPIKLLILRPKVGQALNTGMKDLAAKTSDYLRDVFPGVKWENINITPKGVGVDARLEYKRQDADYWNNQLDTKDKKIPLKLSCTPPRHNVPFGTIAKVPAMRENLCGQRSESLKR